jgi:protein-disulfide isomerase
MEYSDFQCPKCAQVQPDLRALVARYDGRVRLVFRHCPLPQHKWAALAAQAAEAAGLQNRFWEYADQLYAQQTAWSEQSDPRALFQQYAQELGLDVDRWKTDLDSSRLQELVKEERAHAQSLPIAATPTFFVNKKIIVGDSQLQAMGARFIEQELRR